MPKKNIIRQLEKSLNEKLPEKIGQILDESGFCTKSAILTLSDIANIKFIEEHINENRENYRLILQKTRYENKTPFKFLPGHVALIKSLPNEILKISQQKKENKKTRKIQPETNQLSLADNTQSGNSSDVNEIQNSDKSEEIKQELIQKINAFCARKKISNGVSDENILDWRCESGVFKCSVKCSSCPKIIPCNYNQKFWVCGNFTTHWNKHFNVETHQVNSDNTVSIIEKDIHRPPTTSKFIKTAKSARNEVANVLQGQFTLMRTNV